ncbi:hypothetical protein TWF788_008264 [Orbilia oligospora]|uniref:Uncharacterized protein n=1 Tax=Orbilia oligospora TaxID=2813651 RepID=A0A7C8U693_ORBOL|nr:hypothetical protein TWF788_008264 [Orbilia oligospora]
MITDSIRSLAPDAVMLASGFTPSVIRLWGEGSKMTNDGIAQARQRSGNGMDHRQRAQARIKDLKGNTTSIEEPREESL